jgi:cbb3-type cytochrome oxidase subunit 1
VGVKFIKISVIYFAIGVLMGMYMSMGEDHTLTGVHVHINLLGWASMALAGLIYYLFPKAGNNVLAKIHFWGTNIGLPLMMGGLAALLLSGSEQATLYIAIGATLVVISVILFTINVLLNVRIPVIAVKK